MNAFQQRLGIWRSMAIYYGKPFNRRKLMRFYRQFIQPGDVCFDIGAHLGNRTDAWLRLGAQVVSLEPQPQCMRFLRKRFGNHPLSILLDKAAGETPGKGELKVSTLTPTISTLSGADWQQAMKDKTSFKVSWDYGVPVEIVTLDQLVEAYGIPAFVKIDVEDFEYPVLKGLSQPLPDLSFEYFAPTAYRAIQCVEHLDTLGSYVYNWSYGESLQFETDTWINGVEMKDFLTQLTADDRSGDIYAHQVRKPGP